MPFEVLEIKARVHLPQRSRHKDGFCRRWHPMQRRSQALRIHPTKTFMGQQQHPRPTPSLLVLHHRLEVAQLLTAQVAEANAALLQQGAIEHKQFLKGR